MEEENGGAMSRRWKEGFEEIDRMVLIEEEEEEED